MKKVNTYSSNKIFVDSVFVFQSPHFSLTPTCSLIPVLQIQITSQGQVCKFKESSLDIKAVRAVKIERH